MNNRYTMTSPRPWRVELVKYNNSPGFGRVCIISANGEHIADMGPCEENGHEHANAILIVNALNEREVLINLIDQLTMLAKGAISILNADFHGSPDITDETTMYGEPVKPILDKAHKLLEREKNA